MPPTETPTVTVCTFDPIGPEPTPGMVINITGTMPPVEQFPELADFGKFLDSQAEILENALRWSLPGGVYDRLLGRMMLYKSTHFRVPYQK